jgi:hypothetical protein
VLRQQHHIAGVAEKDFCKVLGAGQQRNERFERMRVVAEVTKKLAWIVSDAEQPVEDCPPRSGLGACAEAFGP